MLLHWLGVRYNRDRWRSRVGRHGDRVGRSMGYMRCRVGRFSGDIGSCKISFSNFMKNILTIQLTFPFSVAAMVNQF